VPPASSLTVVVLVGLPLPSRSRPAIEAVGLMSLPLSPSRQQPSVPVSSVAWSTTRSFQVPLIDLPFRPARLPSGLNRAAKGAVPSTIDVLALPSKIVRVPSQSLELAPKLSPTPPR